MVHQSDDVQIPTSLSAYYAPVSPKLFTNLWITLMALGQWTSSALKRGECRACLTFARNGRTRGARSLTSFDRSVLCLQALPLSDGSLCECIKRSCYHCIVPT